jgi:16S rRNA (guanine966-N2)-methyltransferase
MIKIGAGTLAGRIIEQPKTFKTRPLTSKVRATIFNRLGDIEGLTVLDAYAGSGAFGIEALSLGAAHATFIEQARFVAQVITDNIAKLDLVSHTTLYAERVQTATVKLQGHSFDIILVDPPYAELNEADINLLVNHLVNSGIFIVSHSSRISVPDLKDVEHIDSRTYGDTTISYYRGKIG